MKNLVFVITILFAAISANAQGWEHIKPEVDELLGTTGEEFDCYSDGDFFLSIYNEKRFDVNFEDAIVVNAKRDGMGGIFWTATVTYGLYDYNDKLIEKGTACVNPVNDQNSNRVMFGWNLASKSAARRIVNFINNKNGYVRFVAQRAIDGYNVDVKIPTKIAFNISINEQIILD